MFQKIRDQRALSSHESGNWNLCLLHSYEGVVLSERGCVIFPFQKNKPVKRVRPFDFVKTYIITYIERIFFTMFSSL